MTAILVSWFTIGIVLIILEMILPGIFLMWFGLSALIVGIVALIIPIPLNLELILFAVLSVASVIAVLVLVRKHAPDSKSTITSNLNKVRGTEFIGSTFVLDSQVENGNGKLNIGDSVWFIHGPDAPSGTKIQITGVENNTLIFTISE